MVCTPEDHTAGTAPGMSGSVIGTLSSYAPSAPSGS